MLAVALEAFENTLRCGQNNFLDQNGDNRFAILMEELGLLDDLENLQQHPNHNIYNAALKIIGNYFNEEETEDPIMMALSNAGQRSTGEFGAASGGLFEL
jgi:ribosome assembly protein YihI (activator of Der GTPase)